MRRHENVFRLALYVVLALCLCVPLFACASAGSSGSTAQSTGALTTTEKTTITVYCDYSEAYVQDIVRNLTAAFPQYKFDYRYLPNNVAHEELVREFAHDSTVGDVIISRNLDTDMVGLDTSMADLSAKSYCSQYKTAYLKDVESNGRIYYLPMASVVEGIVFNKTLFDENGWSVPTSYEEYCDLCGKVIAAGYGVGGDPLTSYKAQKLFQREYMLDSGRKLSSYKWLTEFNAREASIYDNDWTAVLDDFDTANSFRTESMEFAETGRVDTNDITKMTSREYAMMESSAFFVAQSSTGEIGDEFRLMPFYGSNSNGGWLFSGGSIKFGASAAAMDDPAKAAAIDDIFSFITSDKGQSLISRYSFNIIAPTKNTTSQTDADFFADVQEQLKQGRILEYDSFSNCESMLGDCALAYADGAMDKSQMLATLEKTNREGDGSDAVIATATEDFDRSNMEALLMQALIDEGGTDFSLLCRDTGSIHMGNVPIAQRYLYSNFYQGDITGLDLDCCIEASHTERYNPESEGIKLVRYQMTGRQILSLLEYGKDVYLGGGLTMEYTWDADKNIYLATGFTAENGKSFALDQTYSVTSLSVIPVDADSYRSIEETNIGYYGAVSDWLAGKGSVSPTLPPQSVLTGK